MMRFRNLPIRNKLLLFFLAFIILPVCLTGVFAFHTSRTLLEAKTEQYTGDILLEAGKNLNSKLKEMERLSFQIFSSNTVQLSLIQTNAGIPDEMERINVQRRVVTQLQDYVSSDADIAMVLVIPVSRPVYSLNPATINPVVTKEMMEEMEEADGGAVWFGTDPENRVLAVGREINSIYNQERMGYGVLYLKESCIYDICSTMELFENGEAYVVDGEGVILSGKDKNLLNQCIFSTGMGITTENFQDNFIAVNRAGSSLYAASRAVNNGRWKVFAIIPTVKFEKDILKLRNWLIATCTVFCLLAVLMSVRFSNSISKPLRNLSKMMGKVGQGDFHVSVAAESTDEVGDLANRFNSMVAQIQKLIQEVYQEQYLKQKAELKSLRMQINPHFLYNTLESINWMARTRDVPEIGDMVKALGDLMRASISGDDFVSLRDEIENIANYLMIQKFRYRDRFEAKIHIGGDIGEAILPKLVLQPIVENAIVHGLEKKVGNGRIEIEGVRKDEEIIITVYDNGVGMEREKVDSLNRSFLEPEAEAPEIRSHIGLTNVDRRFKLYYGEEYGLTITSKKGEGTCVKVVFPLDLMKESDMTSFS